LACSAYALPQSYSRLMIDEDSKIVHWYPHGMLMYLCLIFILIFC
jgi:5'-3' exonuclease